MALLSATEQRILCGNLMICGIPGTELDAETKALLREIRPLGLIFFRRNIESPQQICELIAEIKAISPSAILCAVDQEGGRILRIPPPATQWPSLRRLGALSDIQWTTQAARFLGNQLRALNFDMTFAPVLDVDTNLNNPVIGDRSFSSDPVKVAEWGKAWISALQATGIAGCGKHFPGHGDTDQDSHLTLPIVHHPVDFLRRREWLPFQAAVEANVAAMMTAHVVFTECSPNQRPATLCPHTLQYLREFVGHHAAIISDDITMKALSEHYTLDQIARYGLLAGNDVFLSCHDIATSLDFYRSLIHCCEQNVLDAALLQLAQNRALCLRNTYAHLPHAYSKDSEAIYGAEHEAWLTALEKHTS
jgi:beta-N-acetylhexosaminidase